MTSRSRVFYSAQYRRHTSDLGIFGTVYNMHDLENMTNIRPNRNSNSVSINNRTKWDIETGEIRFGIKTHECCWCTGNAGSCRSVCISESRAAYIFISMARILQTQNICITFVQRWSNVFDVGLTLYKCYTMFSCLLYDKLTLFQNHIGFELLAVVILQKRDVDPVRW